MAKYLQEIINYWEYKILGAVIASIFTDSFFKLMLLFCFLEFLDIFTRMICESKRCYLDLYQGFPHSIFTYIKFIPKAHSFRYIQSDKLRSGADKLLTYLLLILSATVVDSALRIAGADKIMLCTTVIVSFCSITEMLSILENTSEFSNLNIIKTIKEKIGKKIGD